MVRNCSLILIIALLAGCGAARNAAEMPPQSEIPLNTTAPSTQDYLYIVSPPIGYEDSALFIYTYPEVKHVITVGAPLVDAAGECADSLGDIYVLNKLGGARSQVLIYEPGTIFPARTLSFKGDARQCSVNSGDRRLAVMTSSKLLVYAKAKGQPKEYDYPQNFTGYACDFDDKGNLFFAGLKDPSKNYATLTELPDGSSRFVGITIPQIPEADEPGGIRWDGKYVALSDGTNQVYRLVIRGTVGQKVATVTLRDTSSVASMWIHGNSIIASSAKGPIVRIWDYPKGGVPTKTIRNVGTSGGVAISIAQ